MSFVPSIDNAYLFVKDGKIKDFGKMQDLKEINTDQVIDAKDRMVLPSWCDSHTHIVFAGNRSKEFIDRIKGLSYEEIAARGGGILNSAKLLQNTSKEDLYKIRDISLNKLYAKANEMGYIINLTSKAKDFLIDKGYDPKYGARPLDRAIQKYLEDVLAEEILSGELKKGDSIIADYDPKKKTIFIKKRKIKTKAKSKKDKN